MPVALVTSLDGLFVVEKCGERRKWVTLVADRVGSFAKRGRTWEIIAEDDIVNFNHVIDVTTMCDTGCHTLLTLQLSPKMRVNNSVMILLLCM